MAMGRKAKQRRQERFWVASTDLPQTVAHPFYGRLNQLLEEGGFDEFVEQQCASFYAEKMGRPSLSPGRYFRLLLMGYFEGSDSERGMAWRAGDSLGLRKFLSLRVEEMVPDHSTISRTRRLIDVETHQAVLRWVLGLLAEKAEHAVDLETGAVVAVTVSGGAAGDTQTILETLPQAGEHIAELACTTNRPEVGERVKADGPQETVADKGYHSNDTLQAMAGAQVRSYISEPDRGQRHWEGKAEAQQAVYGNRRRIHGERGKELLRRRGELLERSFAHAYETGGMRRVYLRGRENVLKRVLLQVGALNLSLVMRQLFGKGTPRGLQGLPTELLLTYLGLWRAILARIAEKDSFERMFMLLAQTTVFSWKQNDKNTSTTDCLDVDSISSTYEWSSVRARLVQVNG